MDGRTLGSGHLLSIVVEVPSFGGPTSTGVFFHPYFLENSVGVRFNWLPSLVSTTQTNAFLDAG